MGSACNCSRKVIEPSYKHPPSIRKQESGSRVNLLPLLNIASNCAMPEAVHSGEATSPQGTDSVRKASACSSNMSTVRRCQCGPDVDSWVGIIHKDSAGSELKPENEGGVSIEFVNVKRSAATPADVLQENELITLPPLKHTVTPSFNANFGSPGIIRMPACAIRKQETLGPANGKATRSSSKPRKSTFGRSKSSCDEVGSPLESPQYLPPAIAIKHVAENDAFTGSLESIPSVGKGSHITGPCLFNPTLDLHPMFEKSGSATPKYNQKEDNSEDITKDAGSKTDKSVETDNTKNRTTEETCRKTWATPRRVENMNKSYKAVIFKNVLKSNKDPKQTGGMLSPRVVELEADFSESGRGAKEKKEDATISQISVIRPKESSSFLTTNWELSMIRFGETGKDKSMGELVPPSGHLGNNANTCSNKQEDAKLALECWSTTRTMTPQEGANRLGNFIIIDLIGTYCYETYNHIRGHGGPVKLCFDSESHQNVAIKFVARSKIKKNFKTRNTFAYRMLESQIATLKKLAHPNLVQFLHLIDEADSSYLYFVTKYVSKGPLLNLINSKGPLSTTVCRKYFKQIISAMDYVHSAADIVHRNLGLHNVFLDEEGNIKVADWGLQFIFAEEGYKDKAGYYTAPETIKKGYKGIGSDIWAAGVCLYYMATGEFPFLGNTGNDIQCDILNKQTDTSKIRDDDMKELVEKLLEKDETRRIKMAEIKTHPWVTNKGKSPMLDNVKEKVIASEEDMNNAILSSCAFR